jgi:hypothetical protein
MGVATFVFWLGRHRFRRVPPRPGGPIGLLDALTTTLLLSPIFALIYGYFVMWDRFQPPEGVSGAALAGPILAHYAWLTGGTAVAVALGFVLFGLRQRRQEDTGFLAVLLYAIRSRRQRAPGQSFFDPARARFGEEAGDGPPAVLRIIVLFSMVSVFWALFDQHASTWLEQAKAMNLVLTVPVFLWYATLAGAALLAVYGGVWLFLQVSNIDVPRRINVATIGSVLGGVTIAGLIDLLSRETKTVELEDSQVGALNPMMVMMIIPLFNLAVWSPLAERGILVKPLTRMTIGMFVAAASFVLAALVQMRIEALGAAEVHVLWQVPQYFLITAAEVLVW